MSTKASGAKSTTSTKNKVTVPTKPSTKPAAKKTTEKKVPPVKKEEVKEPVVPIVVVPLPPVKDIKTSVVKFMLETPANCELTFDQAFDKFVKTVGQTRKPAFKTYYDMCINGHISLTDLTPAKEERAKVDYKSIELKTFVPGVAVLPEKLFEPYKTGKGIDRLFSVDHGVMKGTTIVCTGEAGVGKSTVFYDMAAQIKINYPEAKIAVVNSEMKRTDLEFEYHKNNKPWMKNVEFIVLKDYGYDQMDAVLERIFTSGYDFVVLDSIEDSVAKLKEYCDYTQGRAENFLLHLFDNANEAKNNEGVYTAVLAIQQFTKGGVFVGSNKLNHNTTGMVVLRIDEHGNRYATFKKNRRQGTFVGSKMFYNLDTNGDVIWDEKSFESVLTQKKLAIEAKQDLVQHSAAFNEIFGKINLSDPVTKTTEDEEELDQSEFVGAELGDEDEEE